jgi:hypothetical protein
MYRYILVHTILPDPVQVYRIPDEPETQASERIGAVTVKPLSLEVSVAAWPRASGATLPVCTNLNHSHGQSRSVPGQSVTSSF